MSRAAPNVLNPFLTQMRVIGALAIRGMQTQNAKFELGFAWALVEVLMYFAVISMVRVFIRAFMPPNMPPFTFLVLGVLPWITFMHTVNATHSVIAQERKLLVLPLITPLDLVIAKALQTLCTFGTVYLALLLPCAYAEGAWPPRFPLGVVLLYLAAWLMGLSYGLIMIPAYRMFPPSRWVLHPLIRVGFWTSGAYFVMSSIPETVWPYLTWNPMLHVIELTRTDWFVTYNSPIASPMFIAECVAVMGVLGLSLERYIRRVPV